MSEPKHTPTPWGATNKPLILKGQWTIWDNDGHGLQVATLSQRGGALNDKIDCTEANAAFIVRACNSHDAMVEIQQQFIALVIQGWTFEKATLYDEEGVEGWRWTEPNGTEHYEIGDWSELPTWPDSAKQALADATK